MRMIPLLSAVVLAGLALPVTPAAAAPTYPWCSRNATTAGDCSFDTFAQCEEYLSGIGGGCVQNPGYTGPATSASPGPYNSYSPRHRRHPDR
jgi:uncharacterized protein DUF3551